MVTALAKCGWLFLLAANPAIETGAMAAVVTASAIAISTVREPALATVLSRPAGPAACLAPIVFAPVTSVLVLPIAIASWRRAGSASPRKRAACTVSPAQRAGFSAGRNRTRARDDTQSAT